MTLGFFPPSDSTAVAVLPTPAAVGTPGYFSQGSLTSPATIVGQDFLNSIIAEMQALAAAGGIALTITEPTLVPNIISLINLNTTGLVRKIGDTMTGNLTLGQNHSGNSSTPALVVENNLVSLSIVTGATAGTDNTVVQAGDVVM